MMHSCWQMPVFAVVASGKGKTLCWTLNLYRIYNERDMSRQA